MLQLTIFPTLAPDQLTNAHSPEFSLPTETALMHCAPAIRNACLLDCRASRIASTTTVAPECSKDKDCHWCVWIVFCHTLSLPPDLSPIENKLPFLQALAVQPRSRELAPHKKPIQAKQVADFLCMVGETLTDMGTPDPVSMPMASTLKHSPTSSVHVARRTLHRTRQNLSQSS